VVSLFSQPALESVLVQTEKKLLSYLLSASQFGGHVGHDTAAALWNSCKFLGSSQIEYNPLLQGETVAVVRQLIHKLQVTFFIVAMVTLNSLLLTMRNLPIKKDFSNFPSICLKNVKIAKKKYWIQSKN
jgi:hypothetical protein